MTLSERINNDLKEGMKSKDSFRLSVIRKKEEYERIKYK